MENAHASLCTVCKDATTTDGQAFCSEECRPRSRRRPCDDFVDKLKARAIVCFDFDMTLTGQHSVQGDQPRDMSASMQVDDLRRLFDHLVSIDVEMWIASFADVRTIRKTLVAAGLAGYFAVSASKDVPESIRGQGLFPRAVTDDGDRFWRVLTPSVLLCEPDRTLLEGELNRRKVTMLAKALEISNASRKADAQLSSGSVVLVDDDEENVSVCARNGYVGLGVDKRYQLINSLEPVSTDSLDAVQALQQLFNRTIVVKKRAQDKTLGGEQAWSYYKLTAPFGLDAVHC